MGKIKLAFVAIWGFINPFKSTAETVIDYALGVLKNALAGLPDATKDKIQGVLNTALKVLAVLEAVKFLVPTKWQSAYQLTLEAVTGVVYVLDDLELTKDELADVTKRFNRAYRLWMTPDDETCVEA